MAPAGPQAATDTAMIERILVALDGSPESEEIFQEVERVAGSRTQVDLLHVLESRPEEVPGLGAMTEPVARAYLERFAQRIPDRDVRLHLRTGEPEREIPRAARSLGADLIAMTTHARRGLSRLLMGSVAESIVRRSPIPVLLTRPELARPRKPLERILVPIDGSAGSKEVFQTVREVATGSGVEIVLLQVVVNLMVANPLAGGTPLSVADLLPDPSTSLRFYANRLEREGLRVRPMVVFGTAADQILEQARILDVDLIAMACAGRRGLARTFRRSVSFNVLRHADRAVLLHRIGSRAETGVETSSAHARLLR